MRVREDEMAEVEGPSASLFASSRFPLLSHSFFALGSPNFSPCLPPRLLLWPFSKRLPFVLRGVRSRQQSAEGIIMRQWLRVIFSRSLPSF